MSSRIVSISLVTALLVITSMLAGCPDIATEPEDRQMVSSAQVFNAVKSATGFEIAPLDNTYLLYSREELSDKLEANCGWIRDLPRMGDYRDCDEFAFLTMDFIKVFNLPGIPFGVIKYRYYYLGEPIYHMANIFVDSATNVWIIDFWRDGATFYSFHPSWFVFSVLI